MDNGLKSSKKAIINMELTTFKIPPYGEILVLGKRSAIGPQAAIIMLDTVAPGQFELIEPNDDLIEALLIKKYLFLRIERETLIKTILEEAKAIMSPQCMITIKCDVEILIKRIT